MFRRYPAFGNPSDAIVRAVINEPVTEVVCDVLIAGGGMGGVGAALAVARHNLTACVTEETDWVGGQATSGGVSALDENKFIEISGGTRRYYEFRNRIRQAYGGVRNPGGCYVSALCFEPRIGVQVLEQMLQDQKIKVFPRTVVVSVDRSGDRIASALAWQFEKRSGIRFRLRYLLDATEMGDILPLAKIPYVVGSEPKSDTGEPHAAEKPNPACVQSFTYPFAIERRDGENHRIAKPRDYEAIVKRQQFTLRMNYPVEYGWKGAVRIQHVRRRSAGAEQHVAGSVLFVASPSIAVAGDRADELASAGLRGGIDSRSDAGRSGSCASRGEAYFVCISLLDSG